MSGLTTLREQLLHLRPGEFSRMRWVAASGLCYAAATALGDDIAQSVFVSRLGAEELPRLFLLKGLMDVVAAAIYVPLARSADSVSVWRKALLLYVFTVLSARALVTDTGAVAAYALYVGHECAWTVLTIHWGVLVLGVFDAGQARRLFPLLFTIARCGGLLAGLLLNSLAQVWGAVNLLFLCAGFAGASALVVRRTPSRAAGPSSIPPPIAKPAGLLTGWRKVLASPLVRLIALSTGAMVMVRYGIQLTSLDTINAALGRDEHQVAEFLGGFTAWASGAGIVLGVVVVPRFLTRFGVGVANVTYAVATLLAHCGLLLVPGLGTAVLARFTQLQLKDALKTPLSTLFYGAERPRNRQLARSFVFGAVIPVATAVTSLVFELCTRTANPARAVAAVGVVSAAAFVAVSYVQNQRWRAALIVLLRWRLRNVHEQDARELSERIRQRGAKDAPQATLLAQGLLSSDRRTRAIAEEVLAETIPRPAAYDLARETRP